MPTPPGGQGPEAGEPPPPAPPGGPGPEAGEPPGPAIDHDVLERVFDLLPPAALASAQSTCRSWKRVGDRARLWQRQCEAAGFARPPEDPAAGPAGEAEGLKAYFGRRWIWRKRWRAGRWRHRILRGHGYWIISVNVVFWTPADVARARGHGPFHAETEAEGRLQEPEAGGRVELQEGDDEEGRAAAGQHPLPPEQREEPVTPYVLSIGDEHECLLWRLEGEEEGAEPVARIDIPEDGGALPASIQALGIKLGAFDFSPELLCQVRENGRDIAVFRMPEGRVLATLVGHQRHVDVLELGPDLGPPSGRLVASGGKDQTVRLWNLHGLRAEPPGAGGEDREEEAGPLTCSAAHVFATGSTPKCLLWLSAHSLAAGLYNGRLAVWHFDPAWRRVLRAEDVQVHTDAVLCLKALEGGEDWVISGSRSGAIVVTDLGSGGCPVVRLDGHTGPVLSLFVSAHTVVSGGKDGCVCVWDVRRGADPRRGGEGDEGQGQAGAHVAAQIETMALD